jgi:hypothetical protein
MKARLLAACLALHSLECLAHGGAADFPVLSIQRSEDSNVLLGYQLTPKEKQLFKEIDTEAAKLPADAALSAYHQLAVRIGERYGLTPDQSVAFFTRTTLSEFEP